MGEWMRPKNVKWSAEHERKLSEIQDAFAPFCTNRSATVRTLIDLWYVLLFTPGIIERLNVLLQGTSCALFMRTREQVPAAAQPRKPGPVRAEVNGKPCRTGTDSTTYRLMAKAGSVAWLNLGQKDRSAWSAPFFAGVMGRVA